MRIKHPILFVAAGVGAAIAIAAAGFYTVFPGAPVITKSSATPLPLQPSPSPLAETPSPTPSPLSSPGLLSPGIERLAGRVIDVYPERNIVTLQLPDGKEEIVELQQGKLPEGLAAGNELQFSGRRDTQNGIFAATGVTPLATGTLQFAASLKEVKDRQAFADTLFTKAIVLEFGKALGKPKPFYLVMMDPLGRIVTPFRNDIPSASYRVEGSLATADEARASTQRIRIEDVALGLWTVKLVILPGADMTTIFGFDPGLKPKPLSELSGKLWYFSVAKR